MHCASLRYQISPFLSMFLPERRIRKIHMTTTYTQRPGAAPCKRAAKKWAAFALAMGTAFAAAPVIPSAPASAATGTHDGSSSDKAAASCYEVKQVNPAASSGTYWLYTPQMSGPAQFYCDQETDGGGWVMVVEAERVGPSPTTARAIQTSCIRTRPGRPLSLRSSSQAPPWMPC